MVPPFHLRRNFFNLPCSVRFLSELKFKNKYRVHNFINIIYLAVFFLSLLSGCTETTRNTSGFVLLSPNVVGGLPEEKEFHQALEITEVASAPLNQGSMTRIFVGGRGDFLMRSVLDFRIDLPEDAEIVSGILHLYVLGVSGELPINLSVHLLEENFEETEVTYQHASDSQPWSTPGGDFSSEPLGSASFEGNRVDTVVVELDKEALNDYLSTGAIDLPFIILADNRNSYLGLIARESIPTQPVASRLDLIYKLSGGTTQSLLERRALKDATISQYDGMINGDEYLIVGEIPSSQVFFAYDLSALAPLAMVNQAQLHLWIAGRAIVDSFHVGVHTAHELSFVPPEELFLGEAQGVGMADSSIIMDVTLALQRLILEQPEHTGPNYIVLSSFSRINIAGFLKIYPPGGENIQRRPYLKLICTDAPEAAKPRK
jgi:hypothetical protein